VATSEVKLQEWRTAIRDHLAVEPGHVQAGRRDWKDKAASVAMLKSLSMQDFDDDFLEGFSTVIWDEVHLAGAPVMSQALGRVNGRQVQLSATPGRGVRREIINLHVGGGNWVKREQDVTTKVIFCLVPVGDRIKKKAEWRFQKIAIARDKRYSRVAYRFTRDALAAGRRMMVVNAFIDPLLAVHNELRRDKQTGGGFVIGNGRLKDIKGPEIDDSFPQRSWKARATAYKDWVKQNANPLLVTGLTSTQPGGTGMDVGDLDGGVIMLPVGSVDMTQQLMGRWADRGVDKRRAQLVVMVPDTNQGKDIAEVMARKVASMGAGVEHIKCPQEYLR